MYDNGTLQIYDEYGMPGRNYSLLHRKSSFKRIYKKKHYNRIKSTKKNLSFPYCNAVSSIGYVPDIQQI